MKILWSGWMVRGLLVAALGLFSMIMVVLTDGGFATLWPLTGLAVLVAGLLWASNDVVVITPRTIFRGFRSLELGKVQDLAIRPAMRFVPRAAARQGYEIVAITASGEWPIGLFGEDRGQWGGADPRVAARLNSLKGMILR